MALLNDFGRGARASGYAEVAVARADMATAVPEEADVARAAAALVNGVTAIALPGLARLHVADAVLGAAVSTPPRQRQPRPTAQRGIRRRLM